MNKDLEQKKKPLFTPTTVIEMEDQDENYAFVIHKARLNTCGHVVFTVSTKEITSSKKLIKIPRGKFNNVRFDIDAPRNGGGVVYNSSDCGYPNVRWYGFGGDGPGQSCNTWSLSPGALKIIWYANSPKGIKNADYNWPYQEISYSDEIRKILRYNGWCNKVVVGNTGCSASTNTNENPPTYLPDPD